MANRHTIIVIASIIVIAGSLGYSSVNAISAHGLEFSWPGKSFDFLSVMTDKTVNVCNPSGLPASFSKYSFTIFYDGNDLGTFSTGRGGLGPNSDGVVFGKFESGDDRMASLFFSFLDTETGGTDVTRINTDKIKVTTQLESTILWVVPHIITQEYSGVEFINMINKPTSCEK
ncbi:hypothetical protein [Candidatus Nitrosotenuis aquarius]|uniref:hypothetical protein n=1 Tax=Candidatus Nitrosotenuis aquarius TaxID=1846278 RepID=UPI0013C37B68|nr:hypothetical protein [Candidatus Nitrosotenuis aquarius]